MIRYYKHLIATLVLAVVFSNTSYATHYYGVDMFYTYVSGNTYRVTLVAFGDCSGQQFPALSTSKPLIYIRKGATTIVSDYLNPEPPVQGLEVTPVCPAELANTTCVNPAGTVPGVKKFVYSKEFTLNGTAADWKFVFLGETDGTSLAGRSNSLTNVFPAGIIRLEVTLDNTKYSNSSPEYTTIATPFYCVNKPVNFNPGAVDADGDSLVYELVPGLDTGSSTVPYVTGYSATNPIDAVAGTFKFNSNTGQLSFTAANLQKSLVVYRVSEYRNRQLIGTSMREMTVVILPCNNNPPQGYITNTSGAAIVDNVTVKTCVGSHDVAFDINPTDADTGHIINMVVNGLPKKSALTITANNTIRPRSRFLWNITGVPLGNYTFFITYTDNGCPIASRQTQAYTISVIDEDITTEIVIAGCTELGSIKVITPQNWQPWSYIVYEDSREVYSRNNITGTEWSHNMSSGKYSLHASSSIGCVSDTVVDIPYGCYIVDIPTAFSPNDDGKNDILYVRGKGIKEMNLRIYNRWGQVIFESNDISIGWDGRFRGQEAPIEAYAYVLSGVFKNDKTFHKMGNITLLR